MEVVNVNLWAVLVGAIVSMGIGALWYSPILFVKPWMATIGIKPEDIEKCKEGGAGMGTSFAIASLTSLITTYLLALIFLFANPASLGQATTVAIGLWIGFMAVVHVDGVIWEGRPWKYFFISAGCRLVNIMAITLVLYFWK